MSKMRILSAGRCGTERANWALRDSVLKLEEELTFTKSQLTKVTNEHDTLVMLVKRAWSGDSTASVQVARLVGLASPEYQIQSSSVQVVVKMKLKSRPLNLWAKLTIGLLNNASKSKKTGSSESQSLYLCQRQTYLGEQMAIDAGASRPVFIQSRSSSYSDLSGQAQSAQLQSTAGKSEKCFARRPSCGHLYRPGSHKPTLDAEDHNCSKVFSLNHAGLFGLDDVFVAADARKRPPNGMQQRLVSGSQDKPKSAVYTRSERPLKYETTRPVSAHQKIDRPRTQSANASKLKLRELQRPNMLEDEELEETVERRRNISPASISSDLEEGNATKIENPEMARIRSRIKKPDSVVALDKELNDMVRMEDDFRRNAVELQKRLGISVNGMIF